MTIFTRLLRAWDTAEHVGDADGACDSMLCIQATSKEECSDVLRLKISLHLACAGNHFGA